MLQALQPLPVETHLVISKSARLTIAQETPYSVEQVLTLADHVYSPGDLAAPIASGSYNTLGMVVIPCSMKTLSAVANSYSADLLARAADVTLKEGRPLLLVVREAPLHRGHVRLLDLAAQAGAVIFPPVPAFYSNPQTVDDIVDNIVGRVLRRLGIENSLYRVWSGLEYETVASQPAAASGPFTEETELWALPAMTLATTGADGAPHAAAVYFAATQDRSVLYFFSAAGSQHSLDVQRNPRAAAAIHPLVEGLQEITGLQVRGVVQPVPPGLEWDAAWALYSAKFPFVAGMQEVVARSNLYALRPTWARLTDNRRGFGFKQEWQANQHGHS